MVGKLYVMELILPSEPGQRPWDQKEFSPIGSYVPVEADEFNIGDIQTESLSIDEVESHFIGQFRQGKNAVISFEEAVARSRTSKKPILVVFAHARLNMGSSKHTPFIDWTFTVPLGIQSRFLLEKYEYVPVDLSVNRQRTINAKELAEKLNVKISNEAELVFARELDEKLGMGIMGIPGNIQIPAIEVPPGENDLIIVLVDQDGKVITKKNLADFQIKLSEDDKSPIAFDPLSLIRFLENPYSCPTDILSPENKVPNGETDQN
jgi:hypothetical protein